MKAGEGSEGNPRNCEPSRGSELVNPSGEYCPCAEPGRTQRATPETWLSDWLVRMMEPARKAWPLESET